MFGLSSLLPFILSLTLSTAGRAGELYLLHYTTTITMRTLHDLAVVFSTLTITCVSSFPFGASTEDIGQLEISIPAPSHVLESSIQGDKLAGIALADSAAATFKSKSRLPRHDQNDSADTDPETSISTIPFYSLGPIPIITLTTTITSDDSTATSAPIDSIPTTSSGESPATTANPPSSETLPDGIVTLPPTTAIYTYAPAFEPVPVPIAQTTTSSSSSTAAETSDTSAPVSLSTSFSTDSPTQTTTVRCSSQLATTTSTEPDVASSIPNLPVIITVIPLPESSSSSAVPSSDSDPGPPAVPP